jgi:T4 RnlA family RNA ligase
MNDYQTTLYTDLMTLCSDAAQDSFYYVDQSMGENLYRIFLYRLASYTEFQRPGALECRGHVFRIDADGNAIALVSMAMNKFFNLNENPFVMGLDLNGITHVMDKLDGSLIATVRTSDDSFFLKSKGSFYSTQARDATRLLDTPQYADLKAFCRASMLYDHTVNMEYMAPDNRIVIGYMEPTLKVLNVRCNRTGDYIPEHVYDLHPVFSVASHPPPADPLVWVTSVYESEDDIEGYVCRIGNTWFKLKTNKYSALHKTKDSITIPRRLFEACVKGGADDLRSMFATDALAMLQIDEMHEKVKAIYNHLHAYVHSFYAANKHLERKEYALAGQADKELMGMNAFGLAMNLYIGREADIEEFMIKHYKDYGVKDEAPADVAE